MWALTLILPVTFYANSQTHTLSPNDTDTVQKVSNLREVTVDAIGNKTKGKFGHISFSGSEINRFPTLMGESDVLKTIQASSGVSAGTEGFAGLYVRGGENDQNLYIIDGLPLLNVYHFGGLFSSFNTYAIETADFFKGNFPALYTGKVSGIIDVALKKPDLYKPSGVFSVGLISGQLYYSTPIRKGKSALAVSLRRTWLDIFSLPALAIINAGKKEEGRKTIFNYNFTDFSANLLFDDHLKNELSLLIFLGKDNFKLGEEHFNPDDRKDILEKDINRLSWGNRGAALSWKRKLNAGCLQISPYFSNTFASDRQENYGSLGNGDYISTSSLSKSSVIQTGAKEFISFSYLHKFDWEVGLEQSWNDYLIAYPKMDSSSNGNSRIDSRPSSHSGYWLLSCFGDFTWDISRRLQLYLGFRENVLISKHLNHWNFEPRLNLKIRLPHNSEINLGASRIYQYAQQVSSNYIYLPSDAWLPTATRHKPLRCDILSLGYSQSFLNILSLKSELWWKRMENLADFREDTSPSSSLVWYDKITFGNGNAYGVDIDLSGKVWDISWNVAYGLLWNWRKFPSLNSGKRFPAKFDNRNKLDISLNWFINKRMELSAQWEYMTGNRATIPLYNIESPDIPFPDSPFHNPLDPENDYSDGTDLLNGRNNVRLPSFHRLNLNLSLKGTWSHNISYQWDFGLYNAYCRMNPFSIIKNYDNLSWSDKGDHRKFRTLSLLPILPSASLTLFF